LGSIPDHLAVRRRTPGGYTMPPGVPVWTATRLPARDLEDHAVPGHVVLDADPEALAGSVEDAAGRLRVQVVQRGHANTTVAQEVGIGSVVETVEDVVVAAHLRTVAVLQDHPVPALRLIGDVVHHREVGSADH